MLLSPDQLDALAGVGIFRPNHLNDGQRVDMGEDPFLAIDPMGPQEIDDAVRVQRRKDGGFIVQTAVVDGSQINPEGELMETAIEQRSNVYGRHGVRKRILPLSVVRELELSGRYPHRALVTTETFSSDGQTTGSIDVVPATVRVTTARHCQFLDTYVRHRGAKGLNLPIVAFDRTFRQERGLPYTEPGDLVTRADADNFANNLVYTYMTLANMAFASWSAENEVPILFREFDGRRVWDEGESVWATYTSEPSPHKSLGHISFQAPTYTHATSPLRRTPDLINHVQIGHELAGLELPYDRETLEDLSEHFSSPPARSPKPGN